MTLRLILARHAKSSWDNPMGDDHSRTLNKRGRKSAEAIGQWLIKKGHIPDVVLCSSAQRTRHTCELVTGPMTGQLDIIFQDTLYLAAPEQMLTALHAVQGSPVVMMVAHNPGTALLAAALAVSAPTHPQFDRYPTAATTVLDFQASTWGEIGWGGGNVIDFVVPRDLVSGPQ